MKRLALILLLSSFAVGQGISVAPQVALQTLNGFTRPLAGATITVCAANASGIPCSPVTVLIYRDTALTQPLSNPFTADSNGNYSFSVASGTYLVTVTAANFSGYSYLLTAGSGAAAQVVQLPVEAFGAVGDWNGTTGTDNTTAIQNCINALTVGSCTFQGKAYKISGTLTINKNGAGLSGPVTCTTNAAAFTTPPVCANIVQTSPSADIIDIAGTNITSTIGYNEIKNLRLTRSIIPTGTAKGLSIMFSYGAVVDRVYSSDSIYDFYFKGVGAAGTGHISNDEADWGYNGVTETSGNLYGFYVDSAGGVMSPSIRFRDTASTANFISGPTTYGVYISGTLISDFHAFHMETAQVNYGVYVNQTGGTQTAGTDLHFVDFINDTCLTYCMQINNVLGTVSITGGWDAPAATATAAIDLESSANVSVVSHKIFLGSATTGFLCHSSPNTILADSSILNGSGTDILMNGCTGGSIASVNINGTTGSPIISYTGSSNIPIVNTTLQGTAVATGFSFDSASHNNFGLETDSCISGVTTCISDAGNNALTFYTPPRLKGGLPSASAGTINTNSTNAGGVITGLSAATTLTVTFGSPVNWTAGIFCEAVTSQAATPVSVGSVSFTNVVFNFASLTGSLYYHCDGF